MAVELNRGGSDRSGPPLSRPIAESLFCEIADTTHHSVASFLGDAHGQDAGTGSSSFPLLEKNSVPESVVSSLFDGCFDETDRVTGAYDSQEYLNQMFSTSLSVSGTYSGMQRDLQRNGNANRHVHQAQIPGWSHGGPNPRAPSFQPRAHPADPYFQNPGPQPFQGGVHYGGHAHAQHMQPPRANRGGWERHEVPFKGANARDPGGIPLFGNFRAHMNAPTQQHQRHPKHNDRFQTDKASQRKKPFVAKEKKKKPSTLKKQIMREKDASLHGVTSEGAGAPVPSPSVDDAVSDQAETPFDVAMQELVAATEEVGPLQADAWPDADGTRREYCYQYWSAEIDVLVTDVLTKLSSFQARSKENCPKKAGLRRRLVSGVRQVQQGVSAGTIKFVILSPDIEAFSALNSMVYKLLSTCARKDVPVVFAMSMQTIGRSLGKKSVRMACVGILKTDGAHHELKRAVSLAEDEQKRWKEKHPDLWRRLCCTLDAMP